MLALPPRRLVGCAKAVSMARLTTMRHLERMQAFRVPAHTVTMSHLGSAERFLATAAGWMYDHEPPWPIRSVPAEDRYLHADACAEPASSGYLSMC
jgi:hypothetical protein